MDRLLNVAIWFVKFLIVFVILGAVAYYGAHAWIAEDKTRAARLEQHLYDVALGRGVYGPAAPTGLRLAPTDKAQPKVTYFQDASERPKGGK